MTGGWETVIGLETHVQLRTVSKLFCGCSAAFGAPPNTNVCPVCLGLPGALPVANEQALKLAVRAALALGCTVHPRSIFARKNYFYPDLPKGYQISQFEQPLATGGGLEFLAGHGGLERVTIQRLHVEEDAGKSLHDRFPKATAVDLNRSGVPLVEVVTGPDLRSPGDARDYLRTLKQVLEYVAVSDCDMEKGSLRVDANVSVRRPGNEQLGTKCEVKNINSFANVEKALVAERDRQIALLESGGTVAQQTMLYDAKTNAVRPQRSKEESHDYRYFPDPDLIPLEINQEWIASVRESLPELPEIRRQRFISQYELPEYDAQLLTSSKALANYFEECVRIHPQPKTVSNWIMVELIRELKRAEKEIEQCPVSAQDLAALLDLIREGAISGKMAKAVFEEMFETGKPPKTIVRDRGLVQMTDAAQIQVVIEEVLKNNPDKIAGYQEGKTKLFGYFVGEVMKKTQGKANPKIVNEILRQKLDPSG